MFVFTPKGDVKDLPTGSTPLDFAYRIHTDVGHSTIGAKVNNRLVPLDYKLKNGDIVEIVTTKAARGPSRDWLKVVHTGHAKEKIRQWFKRQERDENIVHGRESLDRELRRLARIVAREDRARSGSTRWPSCTSIRPSRTSSRRSATARCRRQQVVARMDVVDDANERRAAPGRAADAGPDGRRPRQGRGRPDDPIRPLLPPHPGDPIIGYITRGRGVTIHLPTCPTVVNERDIGRLIEVEWEGSVQQTYPIAIRIEAYDRPGLLSEITNVVAENKVNIISANVRTNPDHTATLQATLQVASVAQLAKVLSRIEQVKDVHLVQRDMSSATLSASVVLCRRSNGQLRSSAELNGHEIGLAVAECFQPEYVSA